MDLKIGTLLKEIRNHSQPLKLQKKKKKLSQMYIKVAQADRNSELFRIWSKKALTYKATIHRLKLIFLPIDIATQ